MVTGATSASGRLRRARFTSRLAVDVVVVFGVAAVAGGLARSMTVMQWVPGTRTQDILTLVAAAIGASPCRRPGCGCPVSSPTRPRSPCSPWPCARRAASGCGAAG
jgi:hypothetical protein